MSSDNRKPKLKKIGCFFEQATDSGFTLFTSLTKVSIQDGDIFIYNKGILWKLEKE